MAKKEYALNIFQVIGKIRKGDRSFFKTLSDKEKKEFTPLIIMRWLSGTDNACVIKLLNTYVNRFVFSIPDKDMLYDLMCAICEGGSGRAKWIPKVGTKKYNKSLQIVAEYLGEPLRKTKTLMSYYSNDDILEMSELLGKQKEEIQLLKKELKNRNETN